MARVLLAWELGGGWAHCVNLLPFVRELPRRGHEVLVVAKDVDKARVAFRGCDMTLSPAPHQSPRPRRELKRTYTFAHILHNRGFGHREGLRALGNRWRSLIESADPKLIVFDHSPTALLAARSFPAKRVLVGSGFFQPLDGSPLPDLRPWERSDRKQHVDDEHEVLDNANQLLAEWRQPPLPRLSSLYHPVDKSYLLTFRELDHFPGRPNADYRGVLADVGGIQPQWPRGKGIRVFAYLRPFPALRDVLERLTELECPTIVCGDQLGPDLRQAYRCRTMRFETRRLDLAAVGRECELAILNGNNGTTALMLLAGVPTLQLPLSLEQTIFGNRVTRLGAGVCANPAASQHVLTRLADMFSDESFSAAAVAFAQRYAEFSPPDQVASMLHQVHEMLEDA